MTDDELMEALAAIEHERWGQWQSYMHDLGDVHIVNGQPHWCVPLDRIVAWDRQIATPYAELTEREKESDREQVRRYWHLIRAQ